MNLNTIDQVLRPSSLNALKDPWQDGDSWLAGGTWLFSEPQPHLKRLIDLTELGWEPLSVTDEGLEIAATCTVADLYRFEAPDRWKAALLIRDCCQAFQSSFKIWNAATVGGNICMSLPAGPMISLAVALEGIGTIVGLDGVERKAPIAEFVTGVRQNILGQGDLLRSIMLPESALRKHFAYRRMSLTRFGRSTALLIGTVDPQDGAFTLTITASIVRPVQIVLDGTAGPDDLKSAISAAIPDHLYLDDAHGLPDYRRHLTYYFAEEIRAELAGLELSRGNV
jgi:CO/xanthine dehydrogenase FAD-binding subunit